MQVHVAFGSVPGLMNTVARITINGLGTAPKPAGRHDILVLDCSQSMAGSIDDVREDSQRYINDLTNKDFASVVIFSGHGHAKRIAGPTRADAAGKRLINEAIKKHVRLIGTTVFSEPLSLSLEAAKEAAGEDLIHHSILFTDGNPVPTQWSVADEKKKALEQANQLGSFGAFLSCLGYGFYYDADFLRALTAANGGNGVYLHISDIEGFNEAIDAIKAVAEKMTPVSIELSVTSDKGSASRAFRTTPEVTPINVRGGIHISALYEGGAQLFVELPPGAKSVDIKSVVNGKKVDSIADTFVPGDQADFIRVLGVEAFARGDIDAAQEMFQRTGDDALADNLGGAYSTRDVREAGNAARAYFRDNKFIGSGLKATGPNHNVLNVLRLLIEDEQNMITIPAGAYKRSGVAVADPRVVDSPLGKTLQVVGYVSNQDRFNFSLRAKKSVMVQPEDGKGRPEQMQVWRSFNLILDGNLRIPELLATLSEASFTELQEAGVIKADEVWKQGKSYTLDFRGLKMTSSSWANPKTLRLVDLFKEEANLEAMQKALNARKKQLAANNMAQDVDEEAGIYRESAAPVEGLEKEYYDAQCCDYRLMGYKPDVFDASGYDFAAADKAVKEVRQKLVVVRFMIRSIVFSMEATRSRAINWDAGKVTKRGQHEKLEQLGHLEGETLKRVSWTEQHACS